MGFQLIFCLVKVFFYLIKGEKNSLKTSGFIHLIKKCSVQIFRLNWFVSRDLLSAKQILQINGILSLFSRTYLMVCKLLLFMFYMYNGFFLKKKTFESCYCFEVLLLWSVAWKIIIKSHSLQIMNSQLHSTTWLLKGSSN